METGSRCRFDTGWLGDACLGVVAKRAGYPTRETMTHMFPRWFRDCSTRGGIDVRSARELLRDDGMRQLTRSTDGDRTVGVDDRVRVATRDHDAVASLHLHIREVMYTQIGASNGHVVYQTHRCTSDTLPGPKRRRILPSDLHKVSDELFCRTRMSPTPICVANIESEMCPVG